MKIKYAPGARPPSAGMAVGDTSRYPTGGELPKTPALPTSVAEVFPYMLAKPNANPKMDDPAMTAGTGYSDSGCSSEMC